MPGDAFFYFVFIFLSLFIAWRQGKGSSGQRSCGRHHPQPCLGKTGAQDGGGCASLAGCVSVVGLPRSQMWAPPSLLSSFRGCCNPLPVPFAQVLGGCCSSGARVACGAFSSFVTLVLLNQPGLEKPSRSPGSFSFLWHRRSSSRPSRAFHRYHILPQPPISHHIPPGWCCCPRTPLPSAPHPRASICVGSHRCAIVEEIHNSFIIQLGI